MSPSRYRFLGADVNMSHVMVDIGTAESASVMLELDLLGSFFFVVPHTTENNCSKSQKKKKTCEASRIRCCYSLNMQIWDYASFYTCFD